MNEKKVKKIKEIKEWFKHIKTAFRCTKCGENRSILLDFHHVKPRKDRKKKLTVSKMVILGRSKQAIMQEIKECVTYCKNCHKLVELEKAEKKPRSEKRKWLDEIKQARGACLCGEKRIEILTFDHIDPSTKLFNIGQAITLKKSREAILAEIEKTTIKCLNCHYLHHQNNRADFSQNNS